ncbi:hypothetical protein B0T25DRAFT_522680 [Lasiosphaeria hispida]|uniref:G-patch domain-containing protein n=1 Tax=Lasiosphaeria hispida TaxID=260671 RepID=A0AAJ0H636_9PEZI|nr:hypothetical protein B0T25DRAFT_522680 [Lasiosphaeria hispida]
MDAAALLKSQGWRGKGFSLHPTNNTIGLAKPILVSRNTDGRGVGKIPHQTSDQWWLHAFDQKLKGLDTSKKGAVVQSVTQGKLDVIASSSGKYSGASGLYASFVRGETIGGTLTPDESTDATPASDDRESASHGLKSWKEKRARRARRAARKSRKIERVARKAAEAEATRKAAQRAASKEANETLKASETREERRARRAERRARKEARGRKRDEKANAPRVDKG